MCHGLRPDTHTHLSEMKTASKHCWRLLFLLSLFLVTFFPIPYPTSPYPSVRLLLCLYLFRPIFSFSFQRLDCGNQGYDVVAPTFLPFFWVLEKALGFFGLGCLHAWMRWMDGLTDAWSDLMDAWMDIWIHGWVGGLVEALYDMTPKEYNAVFSLSLKKCDFYFMLHVLAMGGR